MLKAVLDTNVVVSAHLNANGPASLIFRLALSRYFHCVVSEDILAEYSEVLRRDKFRLEAIEVGRSLTAFRRAAYLVNPSHRSRAAKDRDDDKFLECAVEVAADYVVTGNIRDFPQTYLGVEIVTPRAFVNILSSQAK